MRQEEKVSNWKPEFRALFDKQELNALESHIYVRYFGQVVEKPSPEYPIEDLLRDWLHEDADRSELLEMLHWAFKMVDWNKLDHIEHQYVICHERQGKH